MKISRDKGFTIIELLVVIAIIALLTGIITANLTSSRSKARDAKRVFDLSQMQVALDLFFDRCNRFPAAISNPTSAITESGYCPTGINLETFLARVPTPPPNSIESAYVYSVNTARTDYVLKTTLENDNPSILIDSVKTNFSSGFTPAVDCSGARVYCVQPR